MKQPKKLTSKDIFNKAQSSYNDNIDKATSQLGVSSKSIDIFDNASKIDMPTYKGEYSPSAVQNAGQSTRVEFGKEGFNERLGTGLRAEVNPQDAYYESQGGFEIAGKALGSIASGAILKAGQGIALLGTGLGELALGAVDGTLGLIGDGLEMNPSLKALGFKGAMLGGLLEKAGYDGEVNLDDATDNAIVRGLFDAEHYIKKNLFEVYQSTNWNEKSFLDQVTDGAWWGNEGADGIAFALSNFIPGAM